MDRIHNGFSGVSVLAVLLLAGCQTQHFNTGISIDRAVIDVIQHYSAVLSFEKEIDAIDADVKAHPNHDVDHQFTIRRAIIAERCQRQGLEFKSAIELLSRAQLSGTKGPLAEEIRSKGLSVHSMAGLELLFSEDELVYLIGDPRTKLTHYWKGCGPGSFGIASQRIFAEAEQAMRKG